MCRPVVAMWEKQSMEIARLQGELAALKRFNKSISHDAFMEELRKH